MPYYIVYRHGWNDANQASAQGLPEKMAVLRVEADSPEEACRQAAAQVSVAPNQRLTAEPAAPVDAKEGTLGLKPEALAREID